MSVLRGLTAFLLSLHAVAHLVLRHGAVLGVVAPLLVAFAALLGQAGPGPSRDRPQRDRAGTYRVGSLWSLYALLVGAVFLTTPTVEGELGQVLNLLVGSFQLLFLAWPAIGPRGVPLLVNSLVLCGLAVVAGGPVAVSAVAGYAPLAAAFVVADHHELHRARPSACLPPMLGHAALAAGVTWPLLLALPSTRQGLSAPAAEGALSWDALLSSWSEIGGWSLVGLLLIWLARKVLERLTGEKEEAEIEELEHAGRSGESVPLVEAASFEEADLSGARGRILRAFSAFLKRCESSGFARAESTTALEFSYRLPAPARRLARLFGLARYSAEELAERDADEAEAAAAEVLARLKAR